MHALFELLTALPAEGERGLEGLIATIVGDITDHRLRVARSGFQEGADASSADGCGLLKVESKRYRSGAPDANSLRGKLAAASQAAAGPPDVWVLASTAAIGSQTTDGLVRLGDDLGVHVVVLDWSRVDTRLPPLAQAIAAAPEACRRWLELFHPKLVADIDVVIGELGKNQDGTDLRSQLHAQLDPALPRSSVSSAILRPLIARPSRTRTRRALFFDNA